MDEKIRKFKTSDAEACFMLRTENQMLSYSGEIGIKNAWESAKGYPMSYFRNLAKNKREHCFLIERKGQVIGFIDFKIENKATAYLHFLHIRHDLQKQGLGRKLIDFMEKWIQEKYPSVRCVTVETITPKTNGEFYQRLGFAEYQKKPHKFFSGIKIDAVGFKKKL